MSIIGDHDEFVFLPLGGAGEIGMNLNLYGFGPAGAWRWLMIDLGIGFAGETLPGIDIILPDPSFIVDRRDRLEALLLTHAHEDHLGAVPYLWSQLQCPIYGTPFALSVLRRKMRDGELASRMPLRTLPASGTLEIGPFRVEMIGMTHSVPEAQAIVVRTALGSVLHTGDWKLDPTPVIGNVSDEAALGRLGDEGILALICDSTNVFQRGHSGSEADVLRPLTDLIATAKGLVAVTCFATNVARLRTIALAAAAAGRDVIATGASLKRTYAAARECGYLNDVPAFVDEALGGYVPRDKALIVCTGGQGEANAALSRVAFDQHPTLALEAGDTVMFSTRVIPGNEAAIGRLQNQLLRRGIAVVTGREAPIHVSGHPARDELARMYDLVRPRLAIPVHGELRHMDEHARLARDCGVSETLLAQNGTMIRLAPGEAASGTTVASGRLGLDGNRPVAVGSEWVRDRARMVYNGAALVTLVLAKGRRAVIEAQVSAAGLVEGDEHAEINIAVGEALRRAVDAMNEAAYNDDEGVREITRLVVRRAFRHMLDKRPKTIVHLVRM